MYKFGIKSKKKLDTCHIDLQRVMQEALAVSEIDFGINEGHRPISVQQEYYSIGRTTNLNRDTVTNIDGIIKKGKHNYSPSLAVDIYAYVNGRVNWDNENLTYLAGVIRAIYKILYEDSEIDSVIRWGGNWDGDGEIITDQHLKDRPHYEIYN